MAKKRLYSLNALAIECGRNFRTLSRALSDVRPDGMAPDRKPRWHLSTAVAALAEHERRTGRVTTRTPPPRYDPQLEAQIVEIEHSGAELDAFLGRVRGAETVEDRRRLVEREGRVFGRHAKALAATIGSGADAPLRRVYVNEMLGAAQEELLELCRWRLVEAGALA
jgi:hypothetical protein